MADAIGQIPLTINYIYLLKSEYDGANFRKYMERAIVAILDVMQECLNLFMTSSTKKFFGALGKGENYKAELGRKSAKLEQIRTELSFIDNAETNSSTRRTERNVYAMNETSRLGRACGG